MVSVIMSGTSAGGMPMGLGHRQGPQGHYDMIREDSREFPPTLSAEQFLRHGRRQRSKLVPAYDREVRTSTGPLRHDPGRLSQVFLHCMSPSQGSLSVCCTPSASFILAESVSNGIEGKVEDRVEVDALVSMIVPMLFVRTEGPVGRFHVDSWEFFGGTIAHIE
jgi:hypothetical protein